MKNSRKKIFFLLVSAFIICDGISAQISFNSSIISSKKFDFSSVYDSTYGIVKYNNLIISIGGDSVRYDLNGKKVQGWIEDQYTNGNTLHKGYYIDGKIRVFKNFYPQGQLERMFKINDAKRSEMTIYYSNEKVKSMIEYFGETITHEEDYFESGTKEYEENFDKSGLILWSKISYYPNGLTESSLLVTDKRKKKYLQEEFFESGKLKSSGELKLNTVTYDFLKDGVWTYYNESGAVEKTETFNKGELIQ
jgi:antitoxin component YwqK of YwqJK toxin-antitoxin module